MADPAAATQSPSISSSSGADPAGSPSLAGKSCASSCADSFVSSSSSQPVSIFSTSQEGMSSLYSKTPSEIKTSSIPSSSEIPTAVLTTLAGESSKALNDQSAVSKEGKESNAALESKKTECFPEPGAGSGTGPPSFGSSGLEESPFSIGTDVHCNRSSIPTSFPEHTTFLAKETGEAEQHINKGQDLKTQTKEPTKDDKAVSDDDDAKFTLLMDQKSHDEPSKTGGVYSHSSSPSEIASVTNIEKDSPESPFEVIIDKAAFDKEFKESYKESTNEFGSWAMHTDRESSTDIPARVFTSRSREEGRFPTSALLTRQFSRTTAALEEVSRCVSDMHNFTNEMLTWDLVQAKQPEKPSDKVTTTSGLVVDEGESEIPVINPRTSPHQKISVSSRDGSGSLPESAGDLAEVAPIWERAIDKKASPTHPGATKEIHVEPVAYNVQKIGSILPELPGSQFEKCASAGLVGVVHVKEALPDDSLKGDAKWQNSGLVEMTEADSSGESDDTVIEDVVDSSFEREKKESEKVLFQTADRDVIQGEKVMSVPSSIMEADEKKIKESKKPEDLRESVNDFETLQAKPAVLEGSPLSETTFPKASAVSTAFEDVKQVIRREPVQTEQSKFSPTKIQVKELRELAAPRCPDSFHEEKLGGFMRESPNSKRGDSTEVLLGTLQGVEIKESAAKAEVNTFGEPLGRGPNSKTALPMEAIHEGEPDDMEVRGKDSTFSVESQRINDSGLQKFPAVGTPVTSLDLEQEQLTIKALKELGKRPEPPQEIIGAPQEKERLMPTSTDLATSVFAAESIWSKSSRDIPEQTDMKATSGPDLGVTKEPFVPKEVTQVEMTSNSSKTELVNEHALTRLLTEFSVHDLIFWRDVKKTGLVFGTTLIMLLSLAAFSVISVASYLILAFLSVTISFRVYKSVIQAVQKSEEGHPFKAYLDVDIALSSEAFHNYVNAAMVYVNRALKLIIRLFLVEDLVDSLKLAVFMWLMTYVGAVFNGITLLILAELLVFSVPIVYEKYKTQIDHYVSIARDQTKSIVAKIQAKLPGIAKKKAE
ncbi:reticulon-3 isoform X1 [Tachyglossus aculeatus]|uniref:reticulon-3 isoform X1 n=1 Tax=Tachyglossus aculeatus TaxID=9261 RepID=UPI0018F4CF2B|nr:reticulon-3 isoform X1 [Tachyglossus aculeatus]